LFPAYLQDSSYLVASKKRSDLQVVPIAPPEDNCITVKLKLDINEDNNANGSMNIDFIGQTDGYTRSFLMRMNPQERKEMMESLVTGMHPLAILDDFEVSDPENKDEYINCTFDFTIDDYLVENGTVGFLRLEAIRLEIFPFFSSFLAPFNLMDRKYPFKLNNTFMIKVEESVTLAEGISNVSIPDIEAIDKKGLEFKFLSKNFDNKSLQFLTSFAYRQIHFRQEDYKELKNEIARLDSYANSYIILEK